MSLHVVEIATYTVYMEAIK